MVVTAKQREGDIASTQGFGTQIPYEAIIEPGCYICNWSGHLLRIPEEAVKAGHSPLLAIKANETLFVTKVGTDPFLPVTKARMLAADLDIQVNF